MSLMPGAWALAGRRLPMNGEARHRSVGSSLHPPRPGGVVAGTDRDRGLINEVEDGWEAAWFAA